MAQFPSCGGCRVRVQATLHTERGHACSSEMHKLTVSGGLRSGRLELLCTAVEE